MRATFSEVVGWMDQTAVCWDGDDVLKIPSNDHDDPSNQQSKCMLRTPLKSRMIVPIIISAVLDNPGINYQAIQELLKPYANNYALADNILQEGRDLAQGLLFGSPDDNIMYAWSIQAELRKLGHHVELMFANWQETQQKVCAAVLSEELQQLKKLKTTMDTQVQLKFVKKWKVGNGTWSPNELSHGYIHCSICSRHLVLLLKDGIQADGAHSSFGKYTLFSAYGTNANGNMAPLAFGLLFGNEDKKNWSKF